MSYVSGIRSHADWADELVDRHAPPGWRCTFFLPCKVGKSRVSVYGHAKSSSKVIELAVSSLEKTPECLWAVLHEIAHAIHGEGGYYQNLPTLLCGRRPRNSVHPPEFWHIALGLYARYDVVDFALTREYMVGRKYIAAHYTKVNSWRVIGWPT